MKQPDLESLTVTDLVERFAALAVEDDKAEQKDEIAKRKRIRLKIFAVEKELKSRPGDQRRALLPLYDHPNMGVRLLAAKCTLAVAPGVARRMIESIAASNWFPHAGDAGMCLYMLDEGNYVPR
jgi:hypothetical protein